MRAYTYTQRLILLNIPIKTLKNFHIQQPLFCYAKHCATTVFARGAPYGLNLIYMESINFKFI